MLKHISIFSKDQIHLFISKHIKWYSENTVYTTTKKLKKAE